MCFPEGFISTEIVGLEDGVVTMKSQVGYYREDMLPVVLGTGYAQEKESSSFINKTSFIENCETSSVGRALGMAGFGIDVSVASAEEVTNAINNQKEETITPEMADIIGKTYTGANLTKLLKVCKVNDIKDISLKKGEEIIEKLKERAKKNEESNQDNN